MTTPENYCLGGQDNAHRVHTPTTRLLRCALCGRTWPWNETGDALPFHTVPEQTPDTYNDGGK